MPKIIRPYHGDAAYGKNGRSSSSTIYVRTKRNIESVKMVTYTKSYKQPIQPNSSLQLIVRDKMRQLINALKMFQPLYVQNSLLGTYSTPSETFVSDRSRFISVALKTGLLCVCHDSELDKSDDKVSLEFLLDKNFLSFFDFEDFNVAFQIRGDQTDKYFYRDRIKMETVNFDVEKEIYSRDVYQDDNVFQVSVNGEDFLSEKSYNARIWFSSVDFPDPPSDPAVDATSTWDIGNSVRYDLAIPVIL